jgi:hypothetical protein
VQLPRGQPGALKQRPGLAHHHPAEQVAPVQLSHDGERGATDHRGQPAGVAVGEQARRVPAERGDQLGTEPSLGGGAGDLLVAYPQRFGEDGVRPGR